MNRHSFLCPKGKGLTMSPYRTRYKYSQTLKHLVEDGVEDVREDIQAYADCSIQAQIERFGAVQLTYSHGGTSNNFDLDDITELTSERGDLAVGDYMEKLQNEKNKLQADLQTVLAEIKHKQEIAAREKTQNINAKE